MALGPYEETLLVACSHSGNTDETPSRFRANTESEATIMGIAGGGTSAAKCRSSPNPLLDINVIGEARTAAGFQGCGVAWRSTAYGNRITGC